MEAYLEFEKPIVSLEKKLQDLKALAKCDGAGIGDEIDSITGRIDLMIDEIFSGLTPWQKVQLSRHPSRPYSKDYIDALFPSFLELHGDRNFADDHAIIGGTALWPPALPAETANPDEQSRNPTPPLSIRPAPGQTCVMLICQHKGRGTKQKMEHNFGMSRPEGYRKAMRLMDLAERFKIPVITLIDTPGAYPGPDAEEHGQAQAIAESIARMAALRVPSAAVVIGEGGSGGALAIGVADRVLMQEYAIYSVISPESCASILWSDSSLGERASEKLKLFANDLLRMEIIDRIIPEPKGGAHRDWHRAFRLLRTELMKEFGPLVATGQGRIGKILEDRMAKFRRMGSFALASTETGR